MRGVREPDGGTEHFVFAAEISACTIEAFLDPRKPFEDSVVVRRFSIDLRRPKAYVRTLRRILEPWSARAQAVLLSAGRRYAANGDYEVAPPAAAGSVCASGPKTMSSKTRRKRRDKRLADKAARRGAGGARQN